MLKSFLGCKGISDKLVPGAKPALDCPMVFPCGTKRGTNRLPCSFAGVAGLYISNVAVQGNLVDNHCKGRRSSLRSGAVRMLT
ncbi:hypothetical protein OK016_19960 [Vibrio chagasii]|nr:hypothetical protein [Vibrio chagasii]